MSRRPVNTKEAVVRETPARSATCCNVTRVGGTYAALLLRAGLILRPSRRFGTVRQYRCPFRRLWRRAVLTGDSGDPDRGVGGQRAVRGRSAGQQRTGRERNGLRAEVGQTLPAVWSPEMQHRWIIRLDPLEGFSRLQLAAKMKSTLIEMQRRLRVAELFEYGELGESRRLGQVCRAIAEPERRSLGSPWQRHPATVAALLGASGPEEAGILQCVVG